MASAANPLSTSPQPKIHHDNQNTGQSQYIGPQSNHIRWKYMAEDWVASDPTIGTDGTIYLGISDKLYAIKPNGKLKWTYKTDEPIYSTPAISADGTIYIGSEDDKLYAINPNGTLKWAYTTGGMINSPPAINSDGTIYIGSYDDNLYAINPDGTLKWKYKTGQFVSAAPAIGHDGTVYVSSWDFNFYAIKPDGTLKWKYPMIDAGDASIGSDGTIYVGDDYTFYALNPDGTLKWKYTTGEVMQYSQAVSSTGTIYAGGHDGKLYAFKPNGTIKWTYNFGDNLATFPTIGKDGTIYVGCHDKNLYAINPKGTLKWKYTAGDSITASPAISSDGTLYFGSLDENLYAIHDAVHNITVRANLNSGVYYSNKLITLKSNYPATIYYTLNGMTPTESSAVYTHPITITKSTIVKYFAIDSYGDISPIYTKYYTIRHIAPKVTATSPVNGYKMFSRIGMIRVLFNVKVKPSILYNYISVKNLSTHKYVRTVKAIVGNTLLINTTKTRSSNTWYQVTIPQWAVKDYAGYKLKTGYTFKFKTRV